MIAEIIPESYDAKGRAVSPPFARSYLESGRVVSRRRTLKTESLATTRTSRSTEGVNSWPWATTPIGRPEPWHTNRAGWLGGLALSGKAQGNDIILRHVFPAISYAVVTCLLDWRTHLFCLRAGAYGVFGFANIPSGGECRRTRLREVALDRYLFWNSFSGEFPPLQPSQ
jgi:hypothetical protein